MIRPLSLLLPLLLVLLQGCASLAPVAKPQSQALPLSAQTELGRMAQLSLPPQASAGVRPLVQSDFAMDARLALVHRASASLDVQYYLLQNDGTGKALLRALRDAAQRGVRVRLLVDDLYHASSDHLLLALPPTPTPRCGCSTPSLPGAATWPRG